MPGAPRRPWEGGRAGRTPWLGRGACLGEVFVHGVVGGVALEVLPGNQVLDALLDLLRVGLEVAQQLIGCLEYELCVVERLARLHDAHDGGLDRVLAVLVDRGARGILLLLRDLGRDHRHLDAPRAVGESRVVLERVLWFDGLRIGTLLEKNLVLAHTEREGVPLELIGRQVELRLDVGEGDVILIIEDEQDARLVGRHHQVVLLRFAARAEGAEDGRRAKRMHPPQPAVRRAHVVEALERLDARHHLGRQIEIVRLVRRPEARREDLHGEVGVELHLLVAKVLDEGGLHVARQVHVRHHALELRRELRAAAQLELGDHRALGVVGARAREQQPLRQLLLVKLGEDVLVGEVAEEADDLLELVLERVVREALSALLEQVVAEVGEQLGGGRLPNVLVDEDLEGLLHRLVEDRVPLEAALLGACAHKLGVLVVHIEQLLHVRHQIALWA
mmetsp:Transcript_39200/g.103299  ORF Transcript_39200/g.103299 Transcript_39200/m.103299 type:complete len:448 (-) Transcript_39200:1395-2738(-)